MCLTSTDFSEQFQSGSVSGFGFGLLGYKIKQLVMNKMEQQTLPLSGEGRYLTSLYVSGKEAPQEEIKEKIRAALKLLTFLEQHVLVQFWSPCVVGKHQILTTLDQPFGLGVASEELCFYRRSSEPDAFPVDKDNEEIEECTSPPARVYRQELPEWTFDITNYKSKDFPKQDLAIRCNLRGYMALPVFDIARKSCLGVLELLVSSKHMNYVHVVKQVHSALKVSI
nr:NIN-like protein [Tanacetum cinerariifolium]